MFQPLKIKSYLKVMERRGFPSDAVLDNTGLDVRLLDSPDFGLDLAQVQVLIVNMLSLTKNPALGFELGGDLLPSEMGVVGRGMVAAPTFRDTIALWAAYAPSLYGSMLKLSVTEEKNHWHMSLVQDLPLGICYQFCLEEYLALVVNLGHQLLGRPVEYAGLEIIYPPPKHHVLYEELFNCPVQFNAGKNRILVAYPKLDDFIQSRDEYLYTIYLKYCKRQSLQAGLSGAYTYKVHNYLLKRLGSTPSMEDMAEQLGCSVVTLRRRLQEENGSFRELLNRFRRDFAEEHFKTTILSPKEVGFLLGYTDIKPFLRAFKAWTGMTIGEYRRAAGGVWRE